MFTKIITIALVCYTSLTAFSQQAVTPRPSPLAIISMRYKDAYVKLTYSQPHKRGRKVFGSLVQYGQVWRLGANEATEITTTRDIQLNGRILKAGTYSIFVIPQQEKWTIIINSEPGLWGSYNYNSKLDIMRFDVPVQVVNDPIYEAFTMKFDQKNELAELLIMWDNIRVAVPIRFLN